MFIGTLHFTRHLSVKEPSQKYFGNPKKMKKIQNLMLLLMYLIDYMIYTNSFVGVHDLSFTIVELLES